MEWPFAFYVGLRYTGARRKNQLVSFLSIISIAGLVVGVMLLVAVFSVINGFEKELQNRILGLIPQGTIKHYEGIEDWRPLKQEIEGTQGVLAAAPFVLQNALISRRSKSLFVPFYGVSPKEEIEVSNITDYLEESLFMKLQSAEANIILGKDVAEKLDASIADKVMIIVSDSRQNGSAPKVAYFTVLAIVKTSTELDNILAVTSLEHASKLSTTPYPVTGMRIKTNNIFAAPQIVYQSLMGLGPGYSGTNWMRTHGNLSHSIAVSKRMLGLLMSLIVGIAVFNVASTLVMVVIDKRADIAILRTLGASTKKIMSVFLVQGCAIGLIGTVLGIIFGCLLSLGIEDIVRAVENVLGVQFLKSDVYPVTYLPVDIRISDLLDVGLTAFGLSFVATLYPAWRASRTHPAEALRYE